MTSPTTLPPGQEIISPDTLRKYGAVEEMMYRYKDREHYSDNWLMDFAETGTPVREKDLRDFEFIGPIGTTAALSTPLPEARCKCDPRPIPDHFGGKHFNYCPAHPRNRLVRVLPGQMKDWKVKPRELLFCIAKGFNWVSAEAIPSWQDWLKETQGDYAYALPQWSYDEAMGRGKDWPTKGPNDDIAAMETQPESEVKTCLETSSSVMAQQTPACNAAPETSEPFRAAAKESGPTDGELLRFHYESHHQRKYTFEQWREWLVKEYAIASAKKGEK
jgi:hypothetical protein